MLRALGEWSADRRGYCADLYNIGHAIIRLILFINAVRNELPVIFVSLKIIVYLIILDVNLPGRLDF
jgi:hypothetical protein